MQQNISASTATVCPCFPRAQTETGHVNPQSFHKPSAREIPSPKPSGCLRLLFEHNFPLLSYSLRSGPSPDLSFRSCADHCHFSDSTAPVERNLPAFFAQKPVHEEVHAAGSLSQFLDGPGDSQDRVNVSFHPKEEVGDGFPVALCKNQRFKSQKHLIQCANWSYLINSNLPLPP